MTHDNELRVHAEHILDRWSEGGEPRSPTAVLAHQAIRLAKNFLASCWRTDFENCPRDRRVLLLWDNDERTSVLLAKYKPDYHEPTHWAEFVPPTRKEE